mmetsp:Transcript_10674/g.26138  ORF Transcript_10674/g.26138 Transcript_10674/m.26138 type:complete len:349 (-) Transcript_10674:286-1332(-)|eukprot:g3010.t1
MVADSTSLRTEAAHLEFVKEGGSPYPSRSTSSGTTNASNSKDTLVAGNNAANSTTSSGSSFYLGTGEIEGGRLGGNGLENPASQLSGCNYDTAACSGSGAGAAAGDELYAALYKCPGSDAYQGPLPASSMNPSLPSSKTKTTRKSSPSSVQVHPEPVDKDGSGIRRPGGIEQNGSIPVAVRIPQQNTTRGQAALQQELEQKELSLPERIRKGFQIKRMSMKDAQGREVLWASESWDCHAKETGIHLPARILKCKAVAREIEFASAEAIEGFRLQQQVWFKNAVLETWDFHFGFVIPGSTNTWEQTILAAEESEMIPAQLLSGNVVIETTFFSKEIAIATQKIRIFYDK